MWRCLLTHTGTVWNRVIDRHVEVQVLSDVMNHVTRHLLHPCTTKISTNNVEPPPPTSRLCMVCAFSAQNTIPISACFEAGWLGWVGWICVNTCVVMINTHPHELIHTHTHTHALTHSRVTQKRRHSLTQSHTLTHRQNTHAHTHPRTHAHTHTRRRRHKFNPIRPNCIRI